MSLQTLPAEMLAPAALREQMCTPTRWMKQSKPAKSRRRIVCPSLPSGADADRRQRQWQDSVSAVLPSQSPELAPIRKQSPELAPIRKQSPGLASIRKQSPELAPMRIQSQGQESASRVLSQGQGLGSTAPPRPLTVFVRILYFSNDGQQADAGALHEIQVMTTTIGEELLTVVRKHAGVSTGRLLFKMKPLRDMKSSLADNGIMADPRALHLMLPRKLRPLEVAENAAREENLLASHTAAAAAARGLDGGPSPDTGVTAVPNDASEDGNESVHSC